MWTNPEWVSQWTAQPGTQRPQSSTSAPAEDSAASTGEDGQPAELSAEDALDLESVSAVLRDLDTVNAAPDLEEAVQSSNSALPRTPTSSPSNVTPQFGSNNPFAAYSQNNPFSSFNAGGPSNTLATAVGDNLFSLPLNANGTSTNSNNEARTNLSNPLQSALERSATPPEATSNPATANPSSLVRPGAEGLVEAASQQIPILSPQPNFVSPTAIGNTVPYTTPPSNSYNYLIQNAPNPSLPPVTVPAPVPIAPVIPNTSGYVAPVTPNLQTGFNNPTPNFTSPGLQPSQFEAPASPYSIDTRIPGRTLGGGRIGTFSNP